MSELTSDLLALRAALEAAWDESTSSGGYSYWRPSAGQCAVSALVVQDRFGGRLLRTVNTGVSHYWNLVDGREVDLTRDQFSVWAPDGEIIERDRSYLLDNDDTRRRYEILLARLNGGRS